MKSTLGDMEISGCNGFISISIIRYRLYGQMTFIVKNANMFYYACVLALMQAICIYLNSLKPSDSYMRR